MARDSLSSRRKAGRDVTSGDLLGYSWSVSNSHRIHKRFFPEDAVLEGAAGQLRYTLEIRGRTKEVRVERIFGELEPGKGSHLKVRHGADRGKRHAAGWSLHEVCAVKPVSSAVQPLIPTVIDEMIHVLDDEYDPGDPRAVPGLIAALRARGTGRGIPRSISDVFKGIGEAALPGLREVAHDSSEAVRIAAAGVVASFGNDQDAALAEEVMRDKSTDVRLRAIKCTGDGMFSLPVILESLEKAHSKKEA
jgi:hypothetical protein